MNYNDFLTRQQQIKKLSIAEQKNFYEQLLKKKYDKTEVRILASFYYGQLFYQEGNFRKIYGVCRIYNNCMYML